MAALHQHRGAAERERLLDLLVDHGLRQHVALARVARAAVEGAEVAVGDADVRVVDVAVDDERDLVRDRSCARASRRRRAPTATRSRERSSAAASSSVEPRALEHLARGSPATVRRVRRRLPSAVSVRERCRRSAARACRRSRRARRPARRSARRPGALALAEAVAELLEVAREVAGREAVALAGRLRDEVGVLGGLGHGAAQGAVDARRARPGRSRAGRPRPRTPSAGRCARARARRGRGAASGRENAEGSARVADQQARVGLVALGADLGVGHEQLHEHDRGRRVARRRRCCARPAAAAA